MKAAAILSGLVTLGGVTMAMGQTGATVTGTLAIAGKTYKVAHVRAQTRPDPFDAAKKQVRIVFSDVAVSDSAMRDNDAYLDLVNDDKLHAIEFWFNADGTSAGGEIQHDMTSHQFLPQMVTFTKKTFDLKSVAGTIATTSSTSAKFPYKITATFSAPVGR